MLEANTEQHLAKVAGFKKNNPEISRGFSDKKSLFDIFTEKLL